MIKAICPFVLLAVSSVSLSGQDAVSLSHRVHQQPELDGVYYPGPEVSAPRMLATVQALYPSGHALKAIQGMTAFAMVIDPKGIPQHIQTLHSHGDAFDQAASAALKHSTFEPGKLNGVPVPVWIDVRVVFHVDRSQAVPQVLIAERDLPPPDAMRLEDKHSKPLSYTPPFPIHIVDADFSDPFSAHPTSRSKLLPSRWGTTACRKTSASHAGLGSDWTKRLAPLSAITGSSRPQKGAARLPQLQM